MQKTPPFPSSHFQFIMDNPISILIGAGVLCLISGAISGMFYAGLGIILIILGAMFLIIGIILLYEHWNRGN